LSFCLAAQAFAEGLPPDVKARVDAAARGEIARQSLVGLAIGILQDGQITYLQGYGLADRENNLPVTTDSVFNWQSNSKPLAAVAAMQLVERGRLDLMADVRALVPEFPDKGHRITVRDLLSHQSGMVHYDYVPPPTTPAMMDPLVAIDKFKGVALLHPPPRSRYYYSTPGYVLLSAAFQRAGGQDFSDQVQERIVRPLKLQSFQYDGSSAGHPDWVVGYRRSGSTGAVERAPEEEHFWKHGGGGFKCNIKDFARWAQALLNRELVSAPTETQMWTRQQLADGSFTTYGLGFQIAGDDSDFNVSHNGGQPEGTSRVHLFPRQKMGLVLLCNAQYAKVNEISLALRDALSPNKGR
jgi:CubicO group peptidase (beta-lactamase class C family)